MYKIMGCLTGIVLACQVQAAKVITFPDLIAKNDLDALTIPEKISLERVPTLNGTGYIFYLNSPIAEDFIKEQSYPDKRVIEIGAGFSNVAIEAIRKGCGSYVVNDILPVHLEILAKKILKEYPQEQDKFKALEFLPAEVPEELPVFKDPFDAILADKVIHFMEPDEIDLLMNWASKSLKKGGKFYILTISPYIPSFRDRLLPVYLEKKKAGNRYAGFVKNTNQYLKSDHYHTQYTIPQSMTFFDLDDLQSLLKQHGFEVIKSYSLLLPSEKNLSWQQTRPDTSDLVGIIAVKS